MPTEPAPPPSAEEANASLPGSAEGLLAATSDTAGLIRLPAGIELNESQAQELESKSPVRLIVLAGAADCGKTTLLSILYEMFQTGMVDKKQFAGCHTFPAFEKKCHLGRTDSGNKDEDTVRNSYDGPHPEYLHLKLQNGPKALGHVDFLFTDVSGEMFEHARNSTEECKKLTFLLRASHILVFMDCEKLFQPKKCWGMAKDAKSLIQSCLDSGMFPPDCFVTVVWAKYDFVEAAKGEEKAAAKTFMQNEENEIKTRFGSRITNLKFHQAAARPNRSPNMNLGHGVAELLEEWVAKVPVGRKEKNSSTEATPSETSGQTASTTE